MSSCFVDSTLWVDFFKGKNKKVKDVILTLLDEDRIFYNGIVMGELLIGAMGEKEYHFIKDNFEGLKYLYTKKDTFERAAQIGFQLKKSGITVPFTDLLIASHCIDYQLTILTMDKHFKLIAKKEKLSVKFFTS